MKYEKEVMQRKLIEGLLSKPPLDLMWPDLTPRVFWKPFWPRDLVWPPVLFETTFSRFGTRLDPWVNCNALGAFVAWFDPKGILKPFWPDLISRTVLNHFWIVWPGSTPMANLKPLQPHLTSFDLICCPQLNWLNPQRCVIVKQYYSRGTSSERARIVRVSTRTSKRRIWKEN